MLRAESLLVNCEGSTNQRLGLGELLLGIQHLREPVEKKGDDGVLGSEIPFVDRQRLSYQWRGFG